MELLKALANLEKGINISEPDIYTGSKPVSRGKSPLKAMMPVRDMVRIIMGCFRRTFLLYISLFLCLYTCIPR